LQRPIDMMRHLDEAFANFSGERCHLRRSVDGENEAAEAGISKRRDKRASRSR